MPPDWLRWRRLLRYLPVLLFVDLDNAVVYEDHQPRHAVLHLFSTPRDDEMRARRREVSCQVVGASATPCVEPFR